MTISAGKGYDGSDNPSGHAQRKGAAENTQKHSKGLEHCHDLKGVAVVSLWLVGYYRSANESTRLKQSIQAHQTFMAVGEDQQFSSPHSPPWGKFAEI